MTGETRCAQRGGRKKTSLPLREFNRSGAADLRLPNLRDLETPGGRQPRWAQSSTATCKAVGYDLSIGNDAG